MTVAIELTQGFVAVVDEIDADLAKRSWCVKKGRTPGLVYAFRNAYLPGGKRKIEYLHRVIAARMFGEIAGFDVDHMNGDGLNNTRANLQLLTRQFNNQKQARPHPNKSSRFKGVCWYRRDKKWRVTIQSNGKSKHLGYFNSETEAARAYDAAAIAGFDHPMTNAMLGLLPPEAL